MVQMGNPATLLQVPPQVPQEIRDAQNPEETPILWQLSAISLSLAVASTAIATVTVAGSSAAVSAMAALSATSAVSVPNVSMSMCTILPHLGLALLPQINLDFSQQGKNVQESQTSDG